MDLLPPFSECKDTVSEAKVSPFFPPHSHFYRNMLQTFDLNYFPVAIFYRIQSNCWIKGMQRFGNLNLSLSQNFWIKRLLLNFVFRTRQAVDFFIQMYDFEYESWTSISDAGWRSWDWRTSQYQLTLVKGCGLVDGDPNLYSQARCVKGVTAAARSSSTHLRCEFLLLLTWPRPEQPGVGHFNTFSYIARTLTGKRRWEGQQK